MSEGPDRSRPPEPGPLREIELPEFQRHRLSNGVPVWIAERHDLPEVSVRLIVEAGAVADPEGREGLAELTGRLLSEGTGERSAAEMARWLDRLGAGYSVSTGYDATLLSLHLVSDVLSGSLDYLRACVRDPAFEPDEVDRVRQERLDEIERDLDKPEVVADHALIRGVFSDHRYGIPADGVPGSVADLGRSDVTDFHRRAFGAEGAAFVVYGDVEAGAVVRGLEERFGDWRDGGGRVTPAPPPDAADAAGRVLVADRSGSAQAEIRLGTVGTAYGAEDFYPSVVANAVLGGLFNSRVNMNLREEKGWTYGANTSFEFRRAPGPFIGSAAVETEAAGPALEEFLGEIRGMLERPPDEEELGLARNALTLSLPRQFETVSQVTRKVATRLVYDLPDDYWEVYRNRVEAVERDEVVELVRRRLEPERMVMVVAAAADEVVPDLERRFERVDLLPDTA